MILAILAAAAAVSGAPSDVAKLGWMAGSWRELKGGVTTREIWLAPVGGAMAGATQTNRPGKPPTAEFSAITTQPDGHAAFTPFMKDVIPTPFTLLPGKDGEAVFERTSDDFPKRVIYRKCGPDLCARIEGTVKGKLEHQDWRYSRIKP
ncbi:DUF6265 family protein [Phenylobacterium sp.]|uniref:DUF6265 family protein n=1 Tax=Phenylobacterium sp. TaxID=1871053 RepID=UPI00356974DC